MALHKPRRRQPPNPETMLIKCAACGYNPPTTTIRAANPISMVFGVKQFKPPGADNHKNGKPSLEHMQPPSTSLHTMLKRQPTHSQPNPSPHHNLVPAQRAQPLPHPCQNPGQYIILTEVFIVVVRPEGFEPPTF